MKDYISYPCQIFARREEKSTSSWPWVKNERYSTVMFCFCLLGPCHTSYFHIPPVCYVSWLLTFLSHCVNLFFILKLLGLLYVYGRSKN
jgi:hypothetical protein